MSKKSALFTVILAVAVNSLALPAKAFPPPVDSMGTVENLSAFFGIIIKKIYDKIDDENLTVQEVEQDAETITTTYNDNKLADESQTQFIVNRNFIEKWLGAGVPYLPLKKAIEFIEHDKNNVVTNRGYLTIIDFTVPSTEQRMFLMNLETGEIQKSLAAHGARSGGLKATDFSRSNKDESHQTTPGFHRLGEIYSGQHGLSYRLDGLESRNSNARDKNVVIHGAKYATTRWIKRYGWLGRSQGCPAVSPDTMKKLINKKLSGTLLYNYTVLDQKEFNKSVSK